MGRLMGFEPMHIGTTIRGLNRLTTGAITNSILTLSKSSLKKSRLSGILNLAYTLKHISYASGS